MTINGHSGAVQTIKFSPDGKVLASGSCDKFILLWQIFSNHFENYMKLVGHRNAILDLHFTPNGEQLISCSADSTVRAWDAQTGEMTKKMICNTPVNSCCIQPSKADLLVSGSDDGCSRIWDLRVKEPVQTIQGKYPVTAVAFDQKDKTIYSGGIDNSIKVCDLRNKQVVFTLDGHADTITGLRVSPNGAYMLSNAMDNCLNVWDIRKNVKKRCVKTFTGHIQSSEKDLLKCDWSPDGSRVAVGSGDHLVYIWDVASRQLMYTLAGHRGPVIEVAFHPSQPILGTCSGDKNICLRELTQ
eukprot:gnl/MRDRNA2_/MRDRNA2_81441_c0_seq1.p1 gnl/MRDRNA2_/MRDRNA2_81441_c0~~gnl/MRDRNA2_/MRDRNA2_81441_c0_seq1.p1  ORF type:complete len:315 (+),score=1.39 gnl/MRDRNA2_/MRDRNA2_81441_c0_seq1:51-947(+)